MFTVRFSGMPDTVEQGDTFYGGAEFHGKDHPWIIINDPSRHDGMALYVDITSLNARFHRVLDG